MRIASAHKPLLGTVLVDLGLVNSTQLTSALDAQRRRGERIGETLVGLGFLDRRQLRRALAEQRRRWLAAVFGALMMALQPVPAAARSASAEIAVSLTVVDANKTAAQAAPKLTESVADGSASVSLACDESSTVHVSLSGGGATAHGPQHAATCTQPGQPVSISIPVSKGSNPIDVEIAY
jgi:acyl-CoA synthetase (AMP-forming)/AMP-acid ligase II